MVLRNKFKNIEKDNLTSHIRNRSRGNDAPLDAKQVKKEPPPVVKKRPASISRGDDLQANKTAAVPKVTPKPNLLHHRRRQSDTLVGYEDRSFDEPPDIPVVVHRDGKRNSVGELYRKSMADVKDPKMADSSELEANDPDYGNPCTNCQLCKHGWDLHIWRNMCRNCNCTREDHASNSDKPQGKLNTSHSTPKVSDLCNRVKNGEVNSHSLPRPSLTKSHTVDRSHLKDEHHRRSHSMDDILMKDDDIAPVPNETANAESALRITNRAPELHRIDSERLEEEKARSQFNFSDLDHMIDELDLLIDAKVEEQNLNEKMPNLEDFAMSIENQPKIEGKLYDQIKRKISSRGEDIQPVAAPAPTTATKPPLKIQHAIDAESEITTENYNAAVEDNQSDEFIDITESEKVESEESIEDNCQPDIQMSEEACTEERIKETDDKLSENVEEEAAPTTKVVATNFGLKDLEFQIMQMMQLGDIDVYTSDDESPAESEEEMHRRTFIKQIPPNDFLILRHLEELDKYELKEKELFLIHLHQKAIGKGRYIEPNRLTEPIDCAYCTETISPNESFKYIERQYDLAFHEECFKCVECEQSLVDDIYFNQDGNIYCGRHYSEIYKNRCIECDELIFSQKYAVAEEERWHLKHFCCYLCDCELGGERYVIENRHPHCLACYHEALASNCEACKQPIRIGTDWMNFEERNWHACSSCFCCSACNRDLCDMPFVAMGDNIFCSVECTNA